MKSNIKLDKEKVFKIIKNIYAKNKEAAFNNTEGESENVDLTNLVASVPLLMVSYAKVKKHKGIPIFDSYKKTNTSGAGIYFDIFEETSKLIKKGKYPWGTSKTIFIDNSNNSLEKISITIPLFMDKVVQESIRYVLLAIYEPYFDNMNVAFGLRPNITVHDALYTLINNKTQGLNMSLKGDIVSAYSKLNRDKLIEILRKKIKDRKFLNLIRKRLDYEFFDPEKDIFIKDKQGVLQGGTDLQYLWNIYMFEFDNFIVKEMKLKIDNINIKTRSSNLDEKNIINNQRYNLYKKKLLISKILTWLYKKKREKGSFMEDLNLLYTKPIKEWYMIDPCFSKNLSNAKSILSECNIRTNDENAIRNILQKKLKRTIHSINNMPFLNLNKKKLSFVYCRYADDWLILCNLKENLLTELKGKIIDFLKSELYFTLSEKNMLIINIEDRPAQFLGFDIKICRTFKIRKYISNQLGTIRKNVVSKSICNRIFASIDKRRMIDRICIKGYCDKKGFPREISKLNNFEAFTIIDKTNRILLGITNYYANFIRRPKTELSRWIYIIRYSCFKTLALKYKTSIRNILRKFDAKSLQKMEKNTIEDTIIVEIGGERFSKTWKLLTLQNLMETCINKSSHKREVSDRFLDLQNNTSKEFEEEKRNYISGVDFLERSKWTSTEKQATFDLPCLICGCEENIRMYPVKYVRKTKYINLQNDKNFDQPLEVRNKRQMPVCISCYVNIIHKAQSGKVLLNSIGVDKEYNNKIITREDYITNRNKLINCIKYLMEYGWRFEKDQEK